MTHAQRSYIDTCPRRLLLALAVGLCALCWWAGALPCRGEAILSPTKRHRPCESRADTLKASDASHAQRIMQGTFEFADRNFLHGVQYQSDVYVRHKAHTVRRGHIVRYLPQMFRLEKGTHDYLSEASLRVQYRPPGEMDCKVMAFHTTARFLPSQRIASTGRFNFQIYDTRLFADRILNPLHRRNRRFYRYRFRYLSTLDTTTVAHIDISPRFSNSQLIERGEIDVDIRSGAVRKFRVAFTDQMQHFVLSGQAGTGYYDRLLPVSLRILTRFHMLGNEVSEVYDVTAKHHFSCPTTFDRQSATPLDLTAKSLVRMDTTHLVTDRTWFDSIRPIPLRKSEAAIYRQADSIRLAQERKHLPTRLVPATDDSLAYCEKHGVASALFAQPTSAASPLRSEPLWNDLLLSSHLLNMGTRHPFNIRLPAILTPSMVQWSGSKGLSLQTSVKMSCRFQHFDGSLETAPRIGYSFKQHQVYWNVPLTFRFWPQHDAALTLEAGGGSHQYSNKQADDARQRLKLMEHADSLLRVFNHYEFQYYRDTHLRSDFSLQFTPSVRMTVGLRHHYRSLLQWNTEAQLAGLHRSLSSMGPRIQLELTPRTYYYREGKRKVPLYSRFPTLLLSYERGFSLRSAPTGYERLEGDIRFRMPLYALRTLYFRAGGGCYLRRQKFCFLDYDYFRFNNMPREWDDDLTGEFQLLGSQWYNESRHYVRLTSTYESPMLLLSRIPWVSRIIQTERVYCNVLSVSLLKCYTEWGYGISTNVVDVGVFTSLSDRQPVQVGVRCALRLFDR